MRYFRTFLAMVAMLAGCKSATGPTDEAKSTAGSSNYEVGQQPNSVDISQLVPLLSPTFTNWKCVNTGTGPICSGDRLREIGWEASDFPCAQIVYHRYREYRTQTRYYDQNNLNYFRRFHADQPEYFSLSPTGNGTVVVIDATLNWTETFQVPGDDQTLTVKSEGVLFKLKDVNGGVILQWSGSILEPFGGDLEILGGNVNSVKSFTKDPDAFLGAVCQALGTQLLP